MVLLRGARGRLEWKGRGLRRAAHGPARAWPARRVLRGQDPRLRGALQTAATLDAGPAEAARGRQGATEPWTKPAGPLCPLTPPREGPCTPRTPKWPRGQASALGKSTLCPRLLPPRSRGQWGWLSLRFGRGRRSGVSNGSQKATANWNHVVRIKSRSPGFLSLIRAHCVSALKEAVKYLSINEPHLPTDLLTWDSLPSSWTLLAPPALCFRSWAPA